jgi:hypothetical protein
MAAAAACPSVWCGRLGAKKVPDYPHDIAAAWELVDRMIAAGHGVEIHCDSDLGPQATAWCTVDDDDELDSGGTTAPRAITRAFVLAMEGKCLGTDG